MADGAGGFMINGRVTMEDSGEGVGGAGDLNGDGLADLIVGADDSEGLQAMSRVAPMLFTEKRTPMPLSYLISPLVLADLLSMASLNTTTMATLRVQQVMSTATAWLISLRVVEKHQLEAITAAAPM